MKANLTYDGKLEIEFSRNEKELGSNILEQIANIYEANEVDASPLWELIDKISHATLIQ
jgi:uncharacterized protein YccT (UPF0319 family)